MLDYLHDNASQILDGLLFGLGVLAVYLGAVFTGALIRSLGGAGSKGLTVRRPIRRAGSTTCAARTATHQRHAQHDRRQPAQVRHHRGRPPHLVRLAQHLSHAMIRRAASAPPSTIRWSLSRARTRRTRRGLIRSAAATTSTTAGQRQGRRERQGAARAPEREDDYRATYGPLISLVSEKCTSDDSIDLALGRPMEEYRFVIALTYEKLNNRRARHLRAMVMWEEACSTCPRNVRGSISRSTRPASHPAGDRARIPRHPERFGVVNIWRPKESSMRRCRRATVCVREQQR